MPCLRSALRVVRPLSKHIIDFVLLASGLAPKAQYPLKDGTLREVMMHHYYHDREDADSVLGPSCGDPLPTMPTVPSSTSAGATAPSAHFSSDNVQVAAAQPRASGNRNRGG